MKYFIKMTLLLVLLIGIAIPSVYAQTDSDGDGINDDVDKCPNSVRIDTEPPGPDGCYDADGDGLTGDDDLCYNSPLPSNSLGCWDEDQDGFAYDPNYVNQINPRDNCPTVYGTLHGCPDPNASTSTPTSTPDTSHTNTSHTATPTATSSSNTGSTTNTAPSVPASAANCSNSGYQPSRLEIDGIGTLVTDNNSIPLNFRSDSSTDSGVISVIREGEVFVVLDGPMCSGNPNYRWWNVYFDGRSGWVVESTSSDYLARPFTINNEELPDNAIVIFEDLTEVTENGVTRYTYLQERGILEPGTTVRVFMSVPNRHTYILSDILNERTGVVNTLENSTNDDDSTNDERTEEFTVRELDEYSVYGESDVDGKIIIIIIPPATTATTGRGGQQSSDTSATGRGGQQSSDTTATGRGGQQSSSDSSSSAQAAAAAAARNNTSTCNNVAQEIYIYGDSFFSPNGELLDSNADTGWSTRDIADAWFSVGLDGSQRISSIEFNSYSWTGTPGNSIKDFDVTYYDLDNDEFVDLLLGTAEMEAGYATYSFDPVSVDSITIFIVNNHGGSSYEVADIRVCAE